MNGPEFIVEFVRAYAEVMTALGWPLVTIIIFLSVIYYLDRTLNFFGRRKKTPVSWSKLNFLLDQLEYQHQNNPVSTDREERRRMLVCREIKNAREALARHDSERVQEALFIIGTLALESDKNLNKWKAIENKVVKKDAELIIPEKNNSSQDI